MNDGELKKQSEFSAEVLDALIGDAKTAEDLFGRDGLLKRLSAQMIERMLGAELKHHLKVEDVAAQPPNRKNGTSKKTVTTDTGALALQIPRDRNATFAPVLVPKHLRRLPGFDEKILALYSRGLSTRDICDMMTDFYGVEISPDLVSEVTEAVRDEISAWQQRPLASCYAVVWIDAIHLKIRDEGVVQTKAMYVAVGLNLDGNKEVLGLWIEATEGAKFWQRVLSELQGRALGDILILCCDGLKGLPQAVSAVYPRTTVQSCVVHQIRYSLSFASWRDRKQLAAALRAVYAAPTEAAALEALDHVATQWGKRYPMIHESWRRNWETLRPYFELPLELRRIMYTTNQIESLNACIRRTVRAKGHYPSDDAALKSVFLTLRNLEKKWGIRPVKDWKLVYTQLNIQFGTRAQRQT